MIQRTQSVSCWVLAQTTAPSLGADPMSHGNRRGSGSLGSPLFGSDVPVFRPTGPCHRPFLRRVFAPWPPMAGWSPPTKSHRPSYLSGRIFARKRMAAARGQFNKPLKLTCA